MLINYQLSAITDHTIRKIMFDLIISVEICMRRPDDELWAAEAEYQFDRLQPYL